MATCHIEINADVIIVKGSYKIGFSDAIKDAIPKGKRFWNAEDKVWELHPDYENVIVDIALDFYEDVITLKEEVTVEREGKKGKGKAPKQQKSLAEQLAVEVQKAEERLRKQFEEEYRWKLARSQGNGNGKLAKLEPFIRPEHLSALRRVMAKTYHPDNGGSGKVMAEINDLFDKMGAK